MVSFIIVNFNTAGLTKDCVASILTHTAETGREIVVVDNASGDDSPAFLTKAFGDKIKIIVNPANLGFAAANNIGAAAAGGDVLFFLNSDTIIKSDIITPLCLALGNNQNLGIVAPALLLSGGQEQPFAFGYFPNLLSTITQKVFPSRQFKTLGDFKFVDWVSGAALIIRKSVFKEAGAWDEKYFLYFEDIDLCWRVKHRGYDIATLSEISVIHFGGRSLIRNRERKEQYYRAQEYFFRKNYGIMSANILKLIRWPYKTFKILNK